MNQLRTCISAATIIGLSAGLYGCLGSEADSPDPAARRLVSDTRADSAIPVVLIESDIASCTGTLIDSHRILTAAHCAGQGRTLTARIRSANPVIGCKAARATTETCQAIVFEVTSSDMVDAAILVSTQELAPANLAYPTLSPGLPQDFVAIGYSSDGFAPSEKLVQASFKATFTSHDSLVAATRARVCSGDSGMGAFTRDASGRLTLHGVLTSSEVSAADPRCTDPGQVQHWAAGEELGNILAVSRGLVRKYPARPIGSNALSLRDAASRLGGGLLGLSNTPPSAQLTPPVAGARPIGVVTPDAHGTAWVSPDWQPSALEASIPTERDAAGGGVPAKMLMPRWGISNDIDSRKEFLVEEAGRVLAGGTCTGALVGVRLVRTAAHCVVGASSWPTFQLMYHGGARTVSYNGGQTWVTHVAKSPSTYYYGGNWLNFNCPTTRFSGTYQHNVDCLAQDWAILVMSSTVWSDIDVVPKYMGYNTASVRTGVKNTGYPSCSDVTSQYVTSCVNGRMYGQNSCAVSVVTTGGAVQWDTCDSTPGHSGGPIFYYSGSTNYLIGNDSARDANQCASNGCPAAGPGTDSWLYNFTGQLRSQYASYTL